MQQAVSTPSNTTSSAERRTYSSGCRTWDQVAAIWNAKSGEQISAKWAQRVCEKAEAKLRDALRGDVMEA